MKFSRLIVSLTLTLTSAVTFASDYLTIQLKDGPVVIKLSPEVAPQNVARIKALATAGKYNDVAFHRVIDGFMIQGGGFTPDMAQKKTNAPIENEAANGVENKRGTIAMARTNDPHSATSQFFINVVDNARLDPVILPPGDPVTFEFQGQVQKDIPRKNVENHPALFGYTVFGKVVSGMDTVEKIRNTPTGPGGPFPTDAPQKQVVIQSATLVK